MSAFVCTSNITYSCIVELWEKHQEIKNKDLFCQRLYLLNVESVNQRYQLRDSDREGNRNDYRDYMAHLAKIRYEPHPELHDCQRLKQMLCWLYQSCEGDCDEDPLYEAVCKAREMAMDRIVRDITGGIPEPDLSKAYHLIMAFAEKNQIPMDNMWGD